VLRGCGRRLSLLTIPGFVYFIFLVLRDEGA